MADLAVWQRTIVDPAGNTVPNAEVEVRHSDSSALADIYLDREGAQAAPNPITADGNGFVRFYAPGGAYRVEAYGGGATAVWDFVAVGRLAEHDAIGAGQFDDDEGEHEAIRDKLDLASGTEVKVVAEAADTAVDLASEPAREQAAFWRGVEDPVFAVVDGQGNPLFGVNDRGRFFPNAQPEGQFYRDDKDVGLVIAGEDGSPLLEFSTDGWLVGGAEVRPAFWTSDGQADFSVSSSDGPPLLEFDAAGELLGVPRGRAAFYRDDNAQSGLSITDEQGRSLLEFDEQGELLGVPTGRSAFYRDGNAQGRLFITDEQGRSLLEFDEQGNLLGVAAGEDLEDRVEALESDFSGLEASVDSLINQGIPGLQNLPESGEGLSNGAPYSDRRTLKFAPTYSSLYNTSPTTLIPDHLALYALYDDLMSDHDDYISREKLGEDALGNDIFAYHFTAPPHIEGTNNPHPDGVPAKPLIIHVTGTHGFEKGSQQYTYIALKEMCEEWKTQPLLYELRWGCDFVIVPALNPSGIDANTRKNHNGVDLNRNFPAGFGEGTGSSDPESNNYQGPSAGSEAETQVAMTIPTLYPNATAFIDHHMSSSYSSQGYAMWVGAQSQYSRAIASAYLDEMVGYLRHEFADSDQSNIPAAMLSDSILGSITRQMDLSYPASFLFETPTGLVGPNFNTRKHNVEALKRFWRAIYDTEITRRKMAAIIKE